MPTLQYTDEFGTYEVSRYETGLSISSVIDDMVIPVLMAAGYDKSIIEEAMRGEQ